MERTESVKVIYLGKMNGAEMEKDLPVGEKTNGEKT